MKVLYAVFCFYMSWTFIEPVKRIRAARAGTAPDLSEDPNGERRAPAAGLVATGLAAGIMAGMFGIGGGNIIVLTLAFRYPTKRAIATSLAALLLPIGLPGVLYYFKMGTLDIAAAAWVAGGLFLGTIFGAKLTIGMPTPRIRLLYGLFLIFVAVKLLFL